MAQKRKLSALPKHSACSLHTDYLFMMVPLLCWPVFLYGMRPVLLSLVAIITAKICDHLVSMLRKRRYDRSENSSLVHALLLVMLMPTSVPYYVVCISVIFCVMVAKEAFGGYGAYPFHPTGVAYAVAAISWPQYLFRYPLPFQQDLPLWGSLKDILYTESISHVMRTGGIPTTSRLDLLLGNYPSLIGTAPALIIMSCGLFLLIRKRIDFFIPVSFTVATAFVAWCFPRIGNIQGFFWQNASQRLLSVQFELLSGIIMFSAVFLSCEPCTTPKHPISRIIYGVLWGLLTMMYRYYGTYETGVCFALLVVNATSGYIDRTVVKLSSSCKGVFGRVV